MKAHNDATMGNEAKPLKQGSNPCRAANSPQKAVDGFPGSVVAVVRISVREGIEQFIALRKGKTVAVEGRRPQLSGEHWRNTRYGLREFAETFPGNKRSDLTEQRLEADMTRFAKPAPKTGNERRGLPKPWKSPALTASGVSGSAGGATNRQASWQTHRTAKPSSPTNSRPSTCVDTARRVAFHPSGGYLPLVMRDLRVGRTPGESLASASYEDCDGTANDSGRDAGTVPR
jgi:hypothetical protein